MKKKDKIRKSGKKAAWTATPCTGIPAWTGKTSIKLFLENIKARSDRAKKAWKTRRENARKKELKRETPIKMD